MGEPSGKAKDGIARAAKLSAEARRSIARRTAMARWRRRAPKKDDLIFELKEIGLDPAVDASVRVRALGRAAELELKRRYVLTLDVACFIAGGQHRHVGSR